MLLNMIVKNESKIITRLLDSVLPIIDSYCICDTGSTDNTIQVIQDYFNARQIPGKIVQEPFRDFGYNRTFALDQCTDMPAEYVLLMDADMVLQYGPEFSKNKLQEMLAEHSAHYIMQGTSEINYKNVRIVKNRRGVKYWGVTHEYVEVPSGTTYGMFQPTFLFINDVGDGGCKSDKYLRDVRLLTSALEKTPNNDRYTFYLANSYKDSGQPQKAIETYKRRATLGGWIEEVWYSHFIIGRLYKELGEPERAICALMDAFNVFPKRIENLYEIITYYRNTCKYELAYLFYRIADKVRRENPDTDYLFMECDIYNFKLDYELSIIGYYCNPDKYNMVKCCMDLLAYPRGVAHLTNNVLSNYKFYCPIIPGEHTTNSAVPFQKPTEKNWVEFEDANGSQKCICGWHPLIIGDIRNDVFIPTHELPTSVICDRFRGSTNGVRIGDEIWFICHVVSYENQRFYYHTMVILDIHTFNIKLYTPLFTFERERVENVLGFVPYGDDDILIGYSRMDRSTEYKTVKKSWFQGEPMVPL